MTTQKLVRTGMFLAIALVFQIGFRNFAQPLVGPLVNMTLILATLIVGPLGAVIVGIFTPLIAFIIGIIGVPLLVPIIAGGNALYVICFYYSRKAIKLMWKNWISVIMAALVKFAFLYVAVRTFLPLIMPKVPDVLLVTFSLPQLYTALVGGLIAIIIYRLIPVNSDWL